MSGSGRVSLESSIQNALEQQHTSSKAALFLSLEKSQVDKMLGAMEKRHFKAGEVAVKKGEPHREMFIVEDGELTKIFPAATGRGTVDRDEGDSHISTRKEQRAPVRRGEIVGLLHFFSEDPSGSEIVAATDVTVLALSSTKFRAMLAEDPKFQAAFLTLISRRLRKEMGVLRGLGSLLEDSAGEKTDVEKRFKVACFDRKGYFKDAFDAVMAREGHGSWLDLVWFDGLLGPSTAGLAAGCQGVCCFVNDDVSAPVLARLAEQGVGLVALRCAGYDNVDLGTASALHMSVTRVPAYSPSAVAEHAIALLLTLNRKTHKAYERTRGFNFSLEGLVGFDLRGKTAGVFGTGRIGVLTAQILLGFGCKVLACDIYENADLKAAGVKYVKKEELLPEVDILSLHAPLLPATRHWLDAAAIAKMKPTAVIINTSRGPLIDTEALLQALIERRLAGAAMDVLEGESSYFFRDQSDSVAVANTTIARLLSMPNVVVTGHQAFLTHEALEGIAQSTLASIAQYGREGKRGDALTNLVKPQY